ncbi:hypothetical protein FRB99_001307 [Tulasnella sp. 403]|nr:hypothetical protein FRB99_001307 [Tulasnella sp. 403]
MSSSISTRSAITIASLTVVGGIIAYAAYFDYKRRNDPSFRKKLRSSIILRTGAARVLTSRLSVTGKEKKFVEKSKKPQAEAASRSRGVEEIKEALKTVRDEVLPASAEEKEQYFMDNVQMGEALCSQGPMFELPAALAFYRALRVYPSPVELIMIYQKTVPEPVFKIVMEMTSLDVSTTSEEVKSPQPAPQQSEPASTKDAESGDEAAVDSSAPSETSSQEWDTLTDPGSVKQKAEGYYEKFPPASFNVAVEQVPVQEMGQLVKKNVLVAKKDFAVGDVIFKETPGKGTRCSHCFKVIDGEPVRIDSDPLEVAYCSKECETQAGIEHHSLLFGNATVGAGAATVSDPSQTSKRREAQEKLVKTTKESDKLGLLLTARFIGKMVSEETKKLTSPASKSSDDYALFDHLERLRYLEYPESSWKGDSEMLSSNLQLAADGLEEFLKNDRYGLLLGKMSYNAIGVTFGEGRHDKPESPLPVEDRERTRTPLGIAKQVGAALYFISSYLTHSCSPNVKPSFPAGTNELYLVATKDIKKGDTLTMAYVDVSTAEGEDTIEARRRRRQEIARGWRFACDCARCTLEGIPAPAKPTAEISPENVPLPEDDVTVEGAPAQAEAHVERFESGQDGPEFRTGTDPVPTLADDIGE